MPFKPFEKSKADKEPRGMKEGSRKEEALDAKQAKAPRANPFAKAGPAKPAAPMPPKGGRPFAKGGAVKKVGRGC